MHHGWRSSWSGVRTPVRLSVQGPAGEASATAPFSNPLHQWYRRWMGGVSRPHSFFSLWYVTDECQFYLVLPESETKRHPPPHTCSSALHHRCRLAPPEPHLLLVLPLSSPAEGDSNPRLQSGSRLRCRWGTRRKTLLLPLKTQERSVQTEFKIRGWASGPLTPTTQLQPYVMSTAS